jgi:transcriptional regulator with XRE-family HTH domain
MSTKKNFCKKSIELLEEIAGEKLTLGGLILSIRKGEEMSQIEFAELIGVSKQYLCDVEHQRRIVSPKAAISFATKLGYSTDQFVRLCLQDIVDREGINLIVNVKEA